MVKTSDATDPTQPLCLHDTEVTFDVSCRRSAFSSIECYRLVDLRLELVADLLVAKDTGHLAPLCPGCVYSRSGHVTQAAVSRDR